MWTKLTNDNIPKIEVLAIGYQNEMLLGYIGGNEDDAVGFICDNSHEELTEVTHFILAKDLVALKV